MLLTEFVDNNKLNNVSYSSSIISVVVVSLLVVNQPAVLVLFEETVLVGSLIGGGGGTETGETGGHFLPSVSEEVESSCDLL